MVIFSRNLPITGKVKDKIGFWIFELIVILDI